MTINIPEGDQEPVGGAYCSRDGGDMTAVGIELTVGTFTESLGDWQTPDLRELIVDENGVPSCVRVYLNVGVGAFMPVEGSTWLWGKLTDAPLEDAERLVEIEIIYTVPEAPPELPDNCWGPIDAGCNDRYEEYSASVRARAEAMAIATLRQLTAYRVGGCAVTVRPCANVPCAFIPFQNGLGSFAPGMNVYSQWVNNACGCGIACDCLDGRRVVTLEGPVGRVDQVLLDGAVVSTSDYWLDGNRLIYRGTGDGWPLTQNMHIPAVTGSGGVGTFAVTYLKGYPVDGLGAYIAGIMANEFAKACSGDKACQLPSGVVSVVRQGVTLTKIAGSFPGGLTGIKAVDAWITSWNPYHQKQATQVYWPEKRAPRIQNYPVS